MIRVKTMKHIATSATIPGVRSLRSIGRSHQLLADQGRMANGRFQVSAQNAHREWRNQMWTNAREIAK